MPNLSTAPTVSIDGFWLYPMLNGVFVTASRCWIGGSSPTVTGQREAETFNVVGRSEGITQTSGIVKHDEGTLEGLLMDRNGLQAHQWLERLDVLIADQDNYQRIWLVTSRWLYLNVELEGLTTTPTIAGGPAYQVTVPFREKS